MDFFQPTYSWNLTHSKSEGDSAHYYKSSFYYSAEDSTVWNVIIDDRNIWDDEESRWSERVLGGIQFIYSKSLSENVPDWLKNS